MKHSIVKWLMSVLMAAGSGSALAQPEELITAAAELQTLPREFRLDGVVETTNKTTISAQTSGQVQEILYDVNDVVEKDSVLVVLKDTEQQANVSRAAADLKEAVAHLQEARDAYQRTKDIFAKELVAESAMDSGAGPHRCRRGAETSAGGEGRWLNWEFQVASQSASRVARSRRFWHWWGCYWDYLRC